MIPVSGKVKDRLAEKYVKPQNLPLIEQKKPTLSMCRSCSQFEEGLQVGRVSSINWCVFKEWDQVKKCSVTCYRNIKLMECCPKMIKK